MSKKVILLASLCLLTSCTKTSTSTSSIASTSPVASTSVADSASASTSSSTSAETPTDPGFVTASNYKATGVSASGIFSDLGYDIIALVTGKTYSGTITQTGASSATVTISYSVEGVAILSGDMTAGFTLIGSKSGGTVVTVKDVNDYMLYRFAVNVRDELAPDALLDYAANEVNFYYPVMSSYDTYKLTFTSSKAGMFYAKEGDNDYGTQTFTFKIGTAKSSNGSFEYYTLTTTMDDSYASLKLSTILLAINGSSLIPYDSNDIVLNLFKAVF
jgi:osmotically-inducible protein OsmY